MASLTVVFLSFAKNSSRASSACPNLPHAFILGDIPKETENLIKIVEIRNEARKLGITRIFANDKMIRFDPINYRLQLTNNVSNDILIAIELEISKLKKDFKKEKEEG